MKVVVLAALVLGTLVAVPTASATNECRGLNPCVPIAGPWVVVPAGKSLPPRKVQYQLTCPRGFIVAGLDAELTDPAIDVSFIGASGAPVGPGITTSRTVVFVAGFVGTSPKAPTFKPHAGCVPAAGGGPRTPTAVRKIVPPGEPTIRRVVTSRVITSVPIVARCHADERLIDWYFARGFATVAPPPPSLVASLTAKARVTGNSVTVLGQARRGQGMVQVGAVCAGGK